MWTTTQKIGEATALIDAWGFTVKSGAVWVKDRIGMGHWFRSRHELRECARRARPGGRVGDLASFSDNLLTTAANYDSFSVTAPSDPRLPGGGAVR